MLRVYSDDGLKAHVRKRIVLLAALAGAVGTAEGRRTGAGDDDAGICDDLETALQDNVGGW